MAWPTTLLSSHNSALIFLPVIQRFINNFFMENDVQAGRKEVKDAGI
jgi:hypothetical protein